MKEISAERLEIQQKIKEKICTENSAAKRKPLAFVETYGCALNENDSEKLCGMLEDMGYGFCDRAESADLVIFNTCAVRENAELKVFGNIGKLKPVKQERPNLLIGVCGCMMQQAHIKEQIRKKYKHIDMVFGTHALYKFPEILDSARMGNKVFLTEDSDGEIAEGLSTKRESFPLAKVSIMFGCNNFCSYCIVPYVRGRERSRSRENILAEVLNLAQEGFKEVMLLGQNVNSYGNDLEDDKASFAQLLKEVAKIDGIERIRFVTSHPKDISNELIDVIASEPKVCKQLHLPVQSGSDKVLRDMNRKYTRQEYLAKVEAVRKKVPDIVLSTDIIVGFPTETNEDFEDTMSLLREVRFDTVYSFIYSPRVGTPAAKMPMALSEKEIHQNFEKMLDIQNEISREKNEAYPGSRQRILIEGLSKTNPEFVTGRTDGGKIVNVKGGKELTGKIVEVKITDYRTWSLTGKIIKD